MTTDDTTAADRPGAADRITGAERVRRAAYELFTRHGVREVGVDAVVARAGTAKMTLYRNFASKDALVLDVLARRERRWTEEWLIAGARCRGARPQDRLLAVFDLFGEWFARDDFEGCLFLTTMLEIADPDDPVRRAAVGHLRRIREHLAELARGTGIADPDELVRQWHILMKGAIIAAHEGDRGAAAAARAAAAVLLRGHGVDVDDPPAAAS